jgi:Cys-rich four helix bundle protein (predicted Tat secretion target)
MTSDKEEPMNRRELLIGAGAVALATAAHAAPGQDTKPKAAPHHHGDNLFGGAAAAAADCLPKGEACLDHCIQLLSTGDTSLAACAAAVRDMLATCRALTTLASAGSKNAKAMARLASDVARDCEAECKKHANMHLPCKACGEACTRLIKECSQLPA